MQLSVGGEVISKHVALFLSIWVWEVAGMFHFHFYKKMLVSTKCLTDQEERF